MNLATRLSAFFLVALAVVLGGFSVTLYLLARVYLQHDIDEHLGIALDALVVSVDPGRGDWTFDTHRATAAANAPDVPVRWAVFDSHGSVVQRCWNVASDDLAEIYRRGPEFGHIHDSFVDHDGARWRIAVRRLEPATGPDARPASLIIAAAAPLGPMEGRLRTAAWILAGLSSAIWLTAAAVGRRVCTRALLPVTRMAKVACSMTAADRDGRLPSPGTRDELDALARSFNGLLGRLQEEFERQRRFTGDASHQLRTPLTAVLGQLEVALRRDRTATEYRHVLEIVHGEALKLRRIVDSLLFMARAENEAARPEFETVDLVAWAREYLGEWSSHERSNDLREEVSLDAPAWVSVHPALLAQLVDNLLDNACKYSTQGSAITVRLNREIAGVSLAVEDFGPGVSAAELPHVFEPFYRSAEARRRGQPGVGLGLAVVERIAAVLGGTIKVESQAAQGTRFVLWLPDAATPRPSPRVRDCSSVESGAPL
jgi:heavy metal sensor kinase